jgi:hypothetical protein
VLEINGLPVEFYSARHISSRLEWIYSAGIANGLILISEKPMLDRIHPSPPGSSLAHGSNASLVHPDVVSGAHAKVVPTTTAFLNTQFLDEFLHPAMPPHVWKNLKEFFDACDPVFLDQLRLHDVQMESGMAHISGGVSLWRKPLYTLPEGLWIERDLDLEGTFLSRLPAHLHVGRDLNCGTATTALSEDLQVDGDLNLMGSLVCAFPDNVKVFGDLCIELSPLARLRDDEIRLQAEIHGEILR